MVAYANPQQRKKEESEKLRGERDQMKFIERDQIKTISTMLIP